MQELHKLLLEERLAGATLLILANKQDIAGALPVADIQKVRLAWGVESGWVGAGGGGRGLTCLLLRCFKVQ